MIGFLRKLGLAGVASTRKPRSERTVPDVAQSLVSQIIWSWPDSRPFRVQSALEAHPELAESARAVIDLAVEEYADRRDAGEDVSPTLFAKQFPQVQTELLDSLLFENAVEDMTDWFRGVLEPATEEEIKWPEIGEEVAGLRLVEPLGRGGFSRVFVAEDLDYENRRMAVKICRDDTHETQTLATLQHSGIGIVHYVRQIPERGLVAICMPFASRTTLHDVLKSVWQHGCPTTPELAWEEIAERNRIERDAPLWAGDAFSDWVHDLAIGMSHAVAASHEQDIVHCDIKPSNVLVTPEGSPIVIDFNVAFRHRAQSSPANVGGTLPYMAPEQIRAFAGAGYSDIGPHTDVFGIGATLYQLLTGRLPFGETVTADDGIAPLLEARKTPPAPIRNSNPAVRSELDVLIRSCLSYEATERPRDAQALVDELQKLRYGSRPKKPQRHDKTLLVMVAAAALMLALQLAGDRPGTKPTQTQPAAAGIAVLPGSNPHADAESGEQAIERTANDVVLATDKQTQQLVDAGVAAFQKGMQLSLDPSKEETAAELFAEAEKTFRSAGRQDERHKGAFIGRVRSILHQGRLSDAARLGEYLVVDGTPETNACQGLCHAAGRNYYMAAEKLDAAIRGGFDNDNARILLAFSRFHSQDFQGTERVLLELHEKYDEPVPVVNLMLAQSIVMQAMASFTPMDQLATERVERLLDECPRSVERGLIGAEICQVLGTLQQKQDSTALNRWSQRAVEEFRAGVEHGLDPKFWNCFRTLLDKDVEAACEFSSVPAGDGADRAPLLLPMFDPFAAVPVPQLRSRNLKTPLVPVNPEPDVDLDSKPTAVVAQSR